MIKICALLKINNYINIKNNHNTFYNNYMCNLINFLHTHIYIIDLFYRIVF